ncbi:MAG TPA: endonuclease/exonuclease/phosphatase family protein [Pyrinomonadaceae bacterium]|nr:endonuclease/exonuclease/phosphatase family protein [Pyrinomonadaceae bacterium]
MIRFATFNIENLFTRPAAMNQETDAEGREAIEDHATANSIAEKATYSAADKAKLLELTAKYKWHYKDPPRNALVQLQKVRGQLFRKPQNGPVEVVASGRTSWVGWFDLLCEDVNWKATENTGRVISEIKPDILICVEVENRPTLARFNKQVLGAKFGVEYPHFMVIDGNDQRGIDLGILSRCPIVEMRSHVDDLRANGERLYSRDCPEFDIILPEGERVVVIANHLKSKRNGDTQDAQDKRREQAEGAHAIGVAALDRSPLVLLGGDFNDTPDSAPMAELLTDGFEDVMSHPNYPTQRPGTYGTGLKNNKIDYLIMSPQLRGRLTDAGVERRGSYHPTLWDVFPTVTGKTDEASDHHLVWADFDFGS